MLRVIRVSSLVGRSTSEVLMARDGMTGRELAQLYGHGMRSPVVATAGRILWGRTLDEPLQHADVMVAPRPEGIEWAALSFGAKFIIGVTASIFLSGIFRALFPPPSLPPSERGDDRSPTYGWSGIGTTYGAGFRIPIVYGRHRVGGQVISTSVSPMPGNPNSELLSTLLVLGEGIFHSIGGVRVDRDQMGEITAFGGIGYLGDFPAGVQVQGNLLTADTSVMSVRLGNIYQAPVPGFDDARNSVPVNSQLDDVAAEATAIIPTPDANRFAVRMQFPGGLYKQTGGGSYATHRVEFDVQWRSHAQTAWSAPRRLIVAPATPKKQEFSVWFWQTVAAPVGLSAHTAFDVRLVRVTPAGATAAPTNELWVDTALWLDLDYVVDAFLAYPRRALLGVALRASEKMQGGQPDYSIPVEGRTVRVWDEAVGWSTERYFAVPELGDEAGDPFVGIWSHEPGRNPAWIAADLLTSDIGMGAAFTTADLDAEAFRNWADFCDEDSPEAEAMLACDVVLDQGEDAWDVMLRVARAGRAALMVSGSKIKPIYGYRDAHGRGTNVVPARLRTSIIGTSNVEDFEVEYLSTRTRANLIEGQFLNAELDYEQDSLPVEDPNADINDPTLAVPDEVRRSTQEFYGVTSAKQVQREVLIQHALNRLVAKVCRFRCGIDQLPVEVGDIVGVQSDAFRPHGLRVTYFSCRIARTEAALSRAIVLDRDLTITTGAESVVVQTLVAPGSSYPTTWASWLLTAGNGTYAAGTALATSAAQGYVEVEAGTICVVGEFEGNPLAPDDADVRGVEDYLVISATLDGELKREVQAVLWTPDAYDVAASTLVSAEDASDDLGPSATIEQVTALSLAREPAGGLFRLSWAMPEGHRGKRAKVFLRRSTAEPRECVGQVTGDSLVLELDPDAALLASVAIEDDDGTFAAPDAGLEVAVTPPEWRVTDLDPVSGLVAQDSPDGILLTWSPLRSSELAGYEVRRGAIWNGAPVVAQTREPHALVTDLPAGTFTFQVRAQYQGGLYSWLTASVEGIHATPPDAIELDAAAFDETDGVHVDTDVTDGVAIAAFEREASWTIATAITLAAATPALWLIALDTAEEQPGWLGTEDDGTPASAAEWLWRTGYGREASRRLPGCADFDLLGSEHSESGEDWLDPGSGVAGAVGAHTRAQLEVSYDAGAWETYVPLRRSATTIGVRVRLARVSEDYQRRCRGLTVQVTT